MGSPDTAHPARPLPPTGGGKGRAMWGKSTARQPSLRQPITAPGWLKAKKILHASAKSVGKGTGRKQEFAVLISTEI